MAEHVYTKQELISRLDGVLGRRLIEIDNIGMFRDVENFKLQKGIVGTLIERCVFGYEPDPKQEADLTVIDDGQAEKTELKSTGMVIEAEDKKKNTQQHYVAKEPMSITAVSVYEIAEQDFETSHFWNKLEHMLLIYYHYDADHPVSPYEYRSFKIKGYEFHEFTNDEMEGLRQDWERVRALIERVVSHHSGPHDKDWKESVKQEYIEVHGELRPALSYIDLAPLFPPRFRLKQTVVSTIIAKHFGYSLQQLPGRYTVVTDIDRKCQELTKIYRGKTIRELSCLLGIDVGEKTLKQKNIAERIVLAMFGSTAKGFEQVAIFSEFGLKAKTIVLSKKGTRTEDMKLYPIDFDDITRDTYQDEEGVIRGYEFEDSKMYSYFADHSLLCIIFQEQEPVGKDCIQLEENKFIGFKRVSFSDEFIDTSVRRLWNDTREKIKEGRLIDKMELDAVGRPIINKNGTVRSAPNFMKGSENLVFIRGSATDSSPKYKTEHVNGIAMIPQYVWIKGSAVVKEIGEISEGI